ncbi:CDP-alcohol phosphatidyltransferase family protein [Tenggerimyces flavus]|uniref:CDP-alcohol phosphatidyltransferase family protein n=1 Tax=Tenggerimyces flavus TaxID=1708749 RepID=A0ABV7YE86_9ACTN|nr:CDP-alcohol phosphatidyltransferase family protein [Tenggerimyces flavus]MBM7788027.1 cardiolipin synthase [Tenggerimyces flavus]
MTEQAQEADTTVEKVWTVPNILSFLRLAGVPLFLWLVLGPKEDGWAFIVLGIAGLTDYLDGQIARRMGQISTLGKLLDPFADRLYILAVLVGLTIRDIIPLWLVVIILARDAMMLIQILILRRFGYGPLPVHFLGKAATFALLYAFPLLLLGDGDGVLALLANVFGWAFAIWGTALYWWGGILYGVQTRTLLRAHAIDREVTP